MINGFYDLSSFSFEYKKEIIKDAIFLAYAVEIQEKYTEKYPSSRGTTTDSSIEEFIDTIPSMATFDVIDRNIYSRGECPDRDGEVCVHYDFKFLYCHLSLDNLDKLIKRYNLRLRIW